jgi:hypothetical protein
LNPSVETSADYEEFLNCLGDRIALKDWKGYNGGLDVKCKGFVNY